MAKFQTLPSALAFWLIALGASPAFAGIYDASKTWKTTEIPVCWQSVTSRRYDIEFNQRYLPLLKLYQDIATAEFARAGIHLVGSPTSAKDAQGGWGFCQFVPTRRERGRTPLRAHFSQIQISLRHDGNGEEGGHSSIGPSREIPSGVIDSKEGLTEFLDELKFPEDARPLDELFEKIRSCTSNCASLSARFSNGKVLLGWKVTLAVHALLHELGHSLGLHQDHARKNISEKDRKEFSICKIPPGLKQSYPEGDIVELPPGRADMNSIMTYCGPGATSPRLSPDDVATLRRAYGT